MIAILGAGVAGLSTGWLLNKSGIDFVILEKQPYIGGLARSFEWHGFNCDFAAHRLFTHNEAVLQELLNLVPMGRHVRRSRIYLRSHWMHDPLDVLELFARLPLGERIKMASTYLSRPKGLAETNFENFVLRRYGQSLYAHFFQPYTEKLFGIPGDEISVLWARQKVRLKNPLDDFRENTKTKFQYFYYPVRGGYGAIVNRLYEEIRQHVILEASVVAIEKASDRITSVTYEKNGKTIVLPVDTLVSTLPMSINARLLGGNFQLEFQKVEAVYLWLNKPQVSDNHWMYFIDSQISINRMVEFKNMSPVDTDPQTTVVCAEVTQDFPDARESVIKDLERVGLITRSEILDTLVVRENFAYPVYNQNYEQVLAQAEAFFDAYQNYYAVGRSAEFRHREADDNFEAAAEVVKQITAALPVEFARVIEEVRMVEQPALPRVAAVILTFNHFEDTDECLASLQKLTYQALTTIVVDNGSSDGTPDKIRSAYPAVQVIENHRNLGVPAGYNTGFAAALKQGFDYIFMLNNDTILAPDLLEKLLGVAQSDSAAGIVMPKILYHGSEDQVWSSGGRYRRFPPAILLTEKKDPLNDQMRLIEYAPTCGLLIHRRAFERVGLFDPGYFFTFDDWDFSERVRAHGLNIWYAPEAHLWHKVSRTTGGPASPFFWRTLGASTARFYRRHGKPVWISLPVHASYIIFREFIWKRNWKYFGEFWQGLREGMQKPLGSYPTFN